MKMLTVREGVLTGAPESDRSADLRGDGCLIVDATAIASSEHDPVKWVLVPEADGQWTHGPSGVTGSLGEVLWGIASSYDPDLEVPASGRGSNDG
jgi:hypothetical protein